MKQKTKMKYAGKYKLHRFQGLARKYKLFY